APARRGPGRRAALHSHPVTSPAAWAPNGVSYTECLSPCRTMLVQIPYFQGIPPDLLAPLIEGAHRSRARRGEIIALRGEPCDGMHIVVSGRIKLYHETASGLERIMRIIEPGDSFGEAL